MRIHTEKETNTSTNSAEMIGAFVYVNLYVRIFREGDYDLC